MSNVTNGHNSITAGKIIGFYNRDEKCLQRGTDWGFKYSGLRLVFTGLSQNKIIMISNFRRVLNVVCFLLGDSPASEIYMPTFRNTLSVPSS